MGQLSRDVTPTGQGVLTRSDQLNVAVQRSFTERFNAGIALMGVRNQDQLQQPGIESTRLRYLHAGINGSWRVAEHWSLSFAASGATQKYNSNSDSGASYRASIGIVWNGQPRSL
jgi:hypothetical protein